MNDIWLPVKVFIWKHTVGILQGLRHRFLLHFNPKIILDQAWKKEFGYPIDWKHPRDINEKIQYLLVNTDTTRWSMLADKVLVRDYVKECGLEDLLVPLYGVWKSAKAIDFDSLPQRFVLKCNHDSGSTMIIDKSQNIIDYPGIRAFYAACLKRDYGYQGELHYRRVKRRILAEQYLEEKGGPEIKTPVDYKVWCFHGKPRYIFVCYGRTPCHVFVNVYDLDWNCHPEYTVDEDIYYTGDGHLPKPQSLPSMLRAAEILAGDFPEVRIDFYEIDGKPYFGEMTFTSMKGMMKYYTPAFLKEMGDWVIL